MKSRCSKERVRNLAWNKLFSPRVLLIRIIWEEMIRLSRWKVDFNFVLLLISNKILKRLKIFSSMVLMPLWIKKAKERMPKILKTRT